MAGRGFECAVNEEKEGQGACLEWKMEIRLSVCASGFPVSWNYLNYRLEGTNTVKSKIGES